MANLACRAPFTIPAPLLATWFRERTATKEGIVVRGPGYQDWDISILKSFPVREGMHFEFRADFFNIWNHTNFLTGPTGSDGQFEPVAVELGTSQMGLRKQLAIPD